MSNLNIKPLADRVLVEPAAAEEKTASGIIIPDTAKEKPQRGQIVAVGDGKKDEPLELGNDPVDLKGGRVSSITWRSTALLGVYKAAVARC